MRRALLMALAASALLMALLTPRAGGQTAQAGFAGMADANHGDGLELGALFRADAGSAGDATLIVRLLSTSKVFIAQGAEHTVLAEGDNVISYTFPGESVYRSGIDGPYIVEFELSTRSGHFHETYLTRAYRYTEFGDEQGGTPAQVELDPVRDTITIVGNRTVTVIAPSEPALSFQESGRSGEVFCVSFDGVVGYEDTDASGQYTPGTDRVIAELALAEVGFESHGLVDGGVYFAVRGRSAFGGTVLTLTLTFPVLRLDHEAEGQKFDIEFELDAPLTGLDGIALRQTLSDERGAFDVRSVAALDGGRLVYFDRSGQAQGFYAWVGSADAYSRSAQPVGTPVKSRFEAGQAGGTLYLDYPLTEGAVRVHHDPSVGVVFDPFRKAAQEAKASIERHPILFASTALLTLALLAAGIYVQARRGTR